MGGTVPLEQIAAEKIDLTAYRTPGRRYMRMEPASADREWMDVVTQGWANRCLPHLFRTSPGYNLYVRGPSNTSKDYVTPFDAIVETDWLPYPFTMNWRISKPLKTVKFEKDEPICLVMPVKRGDLERQRRERRPWLPPPNRATIFGAWDIEARRSMTARLTATRRSSRSRRSSLKNRPPALPILQPRTSPAATGRGISGRDGSGE